MKSACTIVWFRNDLRLTDHYALQDAVDRGDSIIPVYIHSPDNTSDWPMGAASRWWLHHTLADLDEHLKALGARLVLRSGFPLVVLPVLILETGASTVVWNRRYEPAAQYIDLHAMKALREGGITVKQYGGNILFEPDSVHTASGNFFQVFTPFWKACLGRSSPDKPLNSPKILRPPHQWPDTISLEHLSLRPASNWADGFHNVWEPGISGAEKQIDLCLDEIITDYETDRDRPDLAGTSRLSPHIHFGEVSVRQVWHAICDRVPEEQYRVYLKQLGWRNFSIYMLYHMPDTADCSLKRMFRSFPWQHSSESLTDWQKGQTGYPLIDAGMRELWNTGWMHNRVRMVASSFLVKHLLIPWQAGARWFWDTLVDADLANNTMGWQWITGCGADAAPYFRIFNPIIQSKKFDPEGVYIRRWVPELAKLSDEDLHTPWVVAPHILENAGVILGETYPLPIVDHAIARDRALDAYKQIRKTG